MERFRSHVLSGLHLGSGINALLGRNAQGKTSILEALSCISLTRSFLGASDSTLVRLGDSEFELEAHLKGDAGQSHRVNLTYRAESGEKEVQINGMRVERLTGIVGMFPIVVLSPESSTITAGGPGDRRKFLDIVLSQLSRSYFDDLLQYRHILRQRNKILANARQHGHLREDELEPWNQSMATYGGAIEHRRAVFVEEFEPYMRRTYRNLVDVVEEPGMGYISGSETTTRQSPEEIAGAILEGLRRRQSEECRRGLSLIGPHRDDLALSINGKELQKYASQGQHKTFLIAMKMAEFHYMKDKREESPVLLFDDVLSELDPARSRRLVNDLLGLGQSLVTATDDSPFDDVIPWGNEHRKFHVEQGACRPANIEASRKAAIGAS
jgi:DNA replication and repair protein RecF